jgi:hypothetical protein
VNDTRTHELVVTFTDVCGAARRDHLNFSLEGWVSNATTDGLPLSLSAAAAGGAALPLRATTKLTAAAQGSGAAAPRWAAAAVAAAAGAAAALAGML